MSCDRFIDFEQRYLCAIASTFAVAIVIISLGVKMLGIDLTTFLSGANLIGVTVQRTVGSGSIAFVAALFGVLLGSMWLSRARRIVACLVLTFMVVAIYQTFWFIDWRHEATSKHGNSSLALSMVAGGMAASAMVALMFRQRLKSDEPAA